MKPRQVPLGQLVPDSRNARRHPDRNLETIVDSLSRFGQQKPIVVDTEGKILAGNGTFIAAQRLGWKQLACVTFTGSSDEALAYAIADNRTSDLAEWDVDTLIDTLGELDADLIEAAGFTVDEINELVTPSGDLIDWTVTIPCTSQHENERVKTRLKEIGITWQ